MNIIINVVLFCIISLAVWFGVYSIWGAGSNNFVGRYFSTDQITFVVQQSESTGFQNMASSESPDSNQPDSNQPDSIKPDSNSLSEAQLLDVEGENGMVANSEISEANAHPQDQVIIVVDENGKEIKQAKKTQKIASAPETPTSTKSTTQASASSDAARETIREKTRTKSARASVTVAFQSTSSKPLAKKNGTDKNGSRDDSDSDIRASKLALLPIQKKAPALLGVVDNLPTEDSSTSIFSNTNNRESVEPETSGRVVSQNSGELRPPALPPGTTRALDVKLIYDSTNCRLNEHLQDAMPIMFREGTSAIKGYSLTNLDEFILVYRRCANTLFSVHEKNDETEEVSNSLRQRRLDEVVYYLLHMRVAKADIRIPESS